MTKAGLQVLNEDIPSDPLMPLAKYLDLEGPLK